MTRHTAYRTISIMLDPTTDQRVENVLWKDSVARGDFVMAAIKAACSLSEAGTPIIRKEGTTT